MLGGLKKILDRDNCENEYFEWDGMYKGKMVIPGTYIWRLAYARGTKREFHLTGHISVIR